MAELRLRPFFFDSELHKITTKTGVETVYFPFLLIQ